MPGVANKYVGDLKVLIQSHNIVKKIDVASKASIHIKSKQIMDKADWEKTQSQVQVVKRCKTTKSGRIPLSPESDVWMR